MKKVYLLFYFLISIFSYAQNDNLSQIMENRFGKIVTTDAEKKVLLEDREKRIVQENRNRKSAATNLVEMCNNGGFEQVEDVGGKFYLKNFLFNTGDPAGPTQCKSISNQGQYAIPQYNPSQTAVMATTVPANLIDQYMGDIKAFDQYALKINYRDSGAYGSIVQGKRFKTNNENFLKFNYKAVLQSVYDHSHQDNQAFFKARILNKSNVVVSEFCLVGDEKNCIFTKVPDGSAGYVTLYTANWQAGLLDISSIPNNEEFTVEFMASRCGLGGHFGYAFVDDICLLHATESFVGTVDLDPINAICPTLPLQVCGSYTVPNSGGITATVKTITLKVYDQSGAVVYTSKAANIDAANKKFCFTLTAANLPNTSLANYNVGVDIEYDIPPGSCGGNNFFANASDNDANEGWDISFLNCSASCSITVQPASLSRCDTDQNGEEEFNLADLDNKVVNNTSGLTFAYFKNYADAYNNQSNIVNFSNYSSTSATIYVRITKDAACYKIVPASLVVRNPTANISGILNVCSGSTVLTASEGAQYRWSPGNEITKSITVTDEGTYSVIVTDSYGCSSVASATIVPSQTAITPTLDVTQPSCHVNSGTIKVISVASQYSFDDGKTWTTTAVKAGLNPGIYKVKIKTAKGCESYAQEVEIIRSLLPYPSAYGENPKFCGDKGKITINTVAAFYSFDDGVTWVTDPVAENLDPGKYIIRTKDNSGCISNQQVVVIASQTLGVVDYKLINPACTVKGSITINTPSDFYTFDGGTTWVTNNVLNNITSGTYSVGIKNYLGCTSGFQYIYITKFENQSPEYDVVQPQCGTNGSIFIKTEAAQYSFDNGVTWTNSNVADLPAGSYKLKIKNAAGCVSSTTYVTLYPPTLGYPIYTLEDPVCGGYGKITIHTVADFYSFDGGATWVTTNSKVVAPGSYSIKIKNNLGCLSESTYVSINAPRLPAPKFTYVNPTCSTKGSITFTTVADYYSINSGSTWSTSPVFTGLTGSYYTLMVKNAQGCTSQTASVSFNSVYLDAPTFNIVSPSCGNTTGSIEFTSTADFYSIDGGYTWSSTPKFQNLPKGSYTLRVKTGSCVSDYIYRTLSDTYLADPSVTLEQPVCGTTGKITINATADQYSINGGNTWSTNNVFTNLSSGSYTIKIKTGSCTSSGLYVNIDKPYLPDPDYTFVQPSCGAGGSITITTPADFYSINDGATWSTNPTFTNLPGSYYYIAIKNNQNCTSKPYSVSLSLDKYYLPKPDVEVIQPICGTKGSIKIKTVAAEYSFNGGSTWTTNPVLDNLTGGSYYVMVKNAQGCTSNSYAFSISIIPYYLPTPFVKTVQPQCGSDGSITVVTAADFYSFDNGVTWVSNPVLLNPTPGYYNIKVKNTLGCISNAAYVNVSKFYLSSPQITTIQPTCTSPKGSIIVNTVADLYSFDNGATWSSNPIKNNVNSGYYYVLIKNATGCISQSSYAYISAAPNIPAAPVVTVKQPTACDATDGSIKITTPGISYTFNDGLSWTTVPEKNNMGAGTYVIRVKTNSYSCDSQSVTVTLDSGTTIPAPQVNITQPTCSVSTGSIMVTSAGSTYSYDNGVTFVYANSKVSLPEGTYFIKYKNAAGCISAATQVVIAKPALLPAPVCQVLQPDCNNAFGEITVTSQASEISFDNGLTFGTAKSKSNLPPGTYNVVIKDTGGCLSNVAVFTINPQPVLPQAPQVNITQPLGCTASVGKVFVVSPATHYSYDDGLTWTTDASKNLAPGNYLIKVKLSASGCPSPSAAVTVLPPPGIPALPTATVTQPVTCTSPLGKIVINDVMAFYSFDNGATYGSDPDSGWLPAGTYYLKTKNSAGCESTTVLVTIIKPADTPVKPAVRTQQMDCHHSSATITVLTSAVAYSIDNGVSWNTSPVFSGLQANSYEVRYQNSTGCISDPETVVVNSYVNNTLKPVLSATQSFCIQDNATIQNINIQGTDIRWYNAANGGVQLASNTALSDGVVYYASQIVATCESDRVAVKIKINATPAPSGVSQQLFCISQNATVSDIKINGNLIKWYPNISGSIPLPAEYPLIDGETYYASQTLDNCESVQRLPVTIKISSTGIPGMASPVISNVKIENNNATIMMNDPGTYEFALDGGNWQTNNIYYNLATGDHKILVREKSNICGITEKIFTIFNISNTITPNADGVNDLWKIEGIENYPGSKVEVFDRNAKKVLDKTVSGKFFWNGEFAGRALSTGSYWYKIEVTDGRLLTGFLLIKHRN